MDELIHSGELAIRLMRDDDGDFAMMAAWLTDPRLLEFYEGRDNAHTLERIRREYSPSGMAEEGVTPCLLLLRGTPIGYLQFYPVTEEAKSSYELEGDVGGVFGIDQFIGEPGLWNQGLGTRGVSLLLQYLFAARGARRVVLDPHVSNLRAIRCYERCGFRKLKVLKRHELHEGEYRDSWLMEATPDSLDAGGLCGGSTPG